ncbi:MAG TPA: hypothetical protein VKO16_14140 [Polyangia bacterium]|nr:hypothetical protein [Polyangia bacterium]
MNGQDRDIPLCTRVLERLVDEGEVGSDRVLAEHLGSCVTCFRTSIELRDAPRVAEALRAAAAAAPSPAHGEGFWNDLAVRTTAAAEAAIRGLALPAPSDVRPAPASSRPRPSSVFTRTRAALVATTVAAAAALVMVVHHPGTLSSRAPVAHGPGAVLAAVRSAPDDETGEAAADVADLDGTALRRLLDRLSAHAPAVLTSFGAGDPGEASDTLGDDDRRVNDELADLDGTALRRVASSLGGSSL